MDGAVAERELKGVRCEVATRAHDAALRALFRDTPMSGAISLSMLREPSYFDAAAVEGSENRTVVAIENDRIIACGSLSVRQRFINGQPMRVGYLSGLRVDAESRGKISVIKQGYALLHELHRNGGPEICLTSIVADNLPARRLLERGLKGLPTYKFIGEFVTLIIRSSNQPCSTEKASSAILELINEHNRRYQFAPVWSADDLPQEFCVVRDSGACAALWDQRAIRQTVVRGYSPALHRLRPLINLAATISGRPKLPRIGEPISSAYVSHLACDTESLNALVRSLQASAFARQIDNLVMGFDARDPRLAHLRKMFRPREFVSRLYVVHWEDGAELAESLEDRLLAPEVALL